MTGALLDGRVVGLLGKDEREATEEEIAALESEYGSFLLPDDEG